jgi:peptidoglycan/xylan/chitin deacetylase (PgdA/CDA1 family)
VRGARGIIALTGYHGLLGYKTHQADAPGYQMEVENAKMVINKLKQTGWVFGSHGYAHLDMAKEPMDAVMEDIELWFSQVQPILGDTDLYIYPYGSRIEQNAYRHKLLRERNFNLFFGVGTGYMFEERGEHIYVDRRNIDGFYFREFRDRRDRLFDIQNVIDKEYR